MKPTLAAAVIALTAVTADAAEIAPADRDGIVDAVTAIAAGADRHDWARVRAAFADTVTTDYTGLWGGTPVNQPADDLVAQWAGFLPGFDVTQHLVANHTVIAVTPDQADVSADFQATHRIGDAFWVLGGRYDYRVVRQDDAWRVQSLTMTPVWETGDRGLVAVAAERAAATQDTSR